MEERGGFVNPSFRLFRVTIYARDYFGNARRNDAGNACLITSIFNFISSTTNFYISRRLFQVRFVLNRVFRISITRITRSNIRNGRKRVGAFSFRAFRGLATRIRANYQRNGNSFVFNMSDLRAFFIFQFYQAVSREER